jgi:hypothetical protein
VLSGDAVIPWHRPTGSDAAEHESGWLSPSWQWAAPTIGWIGALRDQVGHSRLSRDRRKGTNGRDTSPRSTSL